ncbi:MAG: FhaA domain-containing protein [Pyrinomonadaceae bacterium]
MGLLESIRRWIDGDGAGDPLASLGDAQRPRRVWEEFLVRVAREVEAVMQREMFTPPGGPTYIPREYIVYLSPDDDKDWQGDKRRGLEQGLFHVLSDRARELSGRTELAAKSFAVELRVDGTLAKGEFRVQPVWDPSESGHTQVTARPAKTATAAPRSDQPAIVDFGNNVAIGGSSSSNARGADSALISAPDTGDSESTVVRPKATELYAVEVWRAGVREMVVPVTKQEITIGRGSRSVPVDLPLKGDPEISRLHALLARDPGGDYWLTSKGRNPTVVNGREIPREERVCVEPDQKIDVCSYSLRIHPT